MTGYRIKNPRTVIDRKKVLAQVDDLFQVAGATPDSVRPELLALLKETLETGRNEVRDRLDQGATGGATVHANSYLIDQILRVMYDTTVGRIFPLTNPTTSERLSLVAVGGYGRSELAPHSDIDLLFLLPYKQTPWGEQVVEYLLYLLWDLGLKVGYATRSVDACIGYARDDMTIRTGLVESRYLWGDAELYETLRQRFQDEIVADTGPEFVDAKLEERDIRHKRLGDSRYLVEPNLKEGKGGLRDLHSLFWIAKYLYPIERISELVDHGVITAAELRTFQRAEEFMWRVRCHLHYLAGRPEERLTFDVQSEIATLMGYQDRAEVRGVEKFMKQYYLIAKSVGSLTRIFCAFIEDQHRRSPRFRLPLVGLWKREVEGFQLDGRRLNVAAEDDFERDPVKMIRIFHLAQQRDYDIHPQALQLMTRARVAVGRQLQDNDEANRLFLEILTSRKAPDVTLRRMNEAGFLGQFLPEFGRVVAQMQHDMYHVYTVDEHSIQAVRILSKIENGDLAEDHPLSARIIHEVLSRRVLYLAVFIHDIAKGRGGDHSELGAEIALKMAARMGFSEGETENVSWLVRTHLAMSNFAFKRDIADPKTVADFSELVQSPERLRLLLVLTVADIRAVGPGVWNGWKGQLLRELYDSTTDHMLGGDAPGARIERANAVKEALRAELSDWTDAEFDDYVARHFANYWLSTDPDTRARHARLVRQAGTNDAPLSLGTRVDQFQAVTEVTLFATDHPGLFARIAGAMAVVGASIVEAKIFTTTDGMALDTFWIQDTEHNAFDRPEKLARLSSVIEGTLSGGIKPREVLADKQSLPERASVFRVAPRVLIDNNASDTHTVIEVNGRDRPGFLSELTYTLFRLNVGISSARIATYGERAVDVFYIRDLFGHKIVHKAKIKALENGLLQVLQGPEEDEFPQAAES
jgi:[protein-PII] uridylyltransferase